MINWQIKYKFLKFQVLIIFLYLISNGVFAQILVGAELTSEYFPELKGKNVAIVANQTSLVGNTHLVDTLIVSGICVKKIF